MKGPLRGPFLYDRQMTLPRYVVLEKRIGQTPLETMQAWKAAHPEFVDVPATYAGRLDPMASGKLLVLLDDECAKREQYTGLDKEYEIEVVLDLSTDTGDALGMPSASAREKHPTLPALQSALASLIGVHVVPYPAFSSKTVNGKPLFQYALEGTLVAISIPEHEETVYRAKIRGMCIMTAAGLRDEVRSILQVVPRSDEPSKTLGADFRQDDIRAAWDALFDSMPSERSFTVVSLRVTCTSGTYMRTLAARLGNALGTSGFALSIHRTKIGRYVPFGPFGWWVKKYG